MTTLIGFVEVEGNEYIPTVSDGGTSFVYDDPSYVSSAFQWYPTGLTLDLFTLVNSVEFLDNFATINENVFLDGLNLVSGDLNLNSFGYSGGVTTVDAFEYSGSLFDEDGFIFIGG